MPRSGSSGEVIEIRISNRPSQKEVSWADKDWTIRLLRGLIQIEDEVLIFDGEEQEFCLPSRWSLRELANRPGEWYAVVEHERTGDLAILQDQFGNNTLFVSINTEGSGTYLRLSSSFRAIQGLRNLRGQATDLNLPAAFSALCSFTNLFRTRLSTSSFDTQVEILRHDNYILLSDRGCSISKIPSHRKLDGMSYGELLDYGIDQASKQLTSLARSGIDATLGLSGGKDSRLLLAIMVAAGVTDQISVNTVDPRSMAPSASKDILLKDFELATILHRGLGLSWKEHGVLESREIGPATSIDHWQNFRSNNSFEYTPRTFFQTSGEPSINLLGIGGELVRSYIGMSYTKSFPDWWSECGKTNDYLIHDLGLLYSKLVNPSSVPPKFHAEAKSYFAGQMASLAGDGNVIEALDNQYAEFRSRCHVGNTLGSAASGIYQFYPLAQPAFIEAGKRLPIDDLQDGRVMFDIFLRTEPELLKLPFASPPWPERFMSEIDNLRDPWKNIDNQRSIEEFDKSKEKNNANMSRRGESVSSHNVALFEREKVISNVDQILERLTPIIGSADAALVEQRIALSAFKNSLGLRSFLGKTESILDVWHIPSEIRVVRLEPCGGSSTRSVRSESCVRHRTEERTIDFSNTVETTSFERVEININQQADMAEVEVIGMQGEAKIAVYWYLDGKEFSRSPYANQDKVDVRLPEFRPGNRVRALVFLKWNHLHEASRIDSAELTLQ